MGEPFLGERLAPVLLQPRVLEVMLDTIADPLFVKDEQHVWLYVNEAAASLIGRARDTLIGKSDCDFFSEAEARVFWEKDNEVFHSGIPNINLEAFTNASGKTFIVETKKCVVQLDAGTRVLVAILRDVTELTAAKAHLQQALDATQVGTWVFEPTSEQLVPDERFCNIFGRARFVPGRPTAFGHLGESTSALVRSALETARTAGTLDVTVRTQTDAGETRHVRITGRRMTAAPGTLLSKDMLIGTARDVTASVRAELELLEAKEQAEAASVAKSSFLATMSHEIRTPLNALLGYTQLLARDAALNDRQRAQVDIVYSSGRHLLALLNDILDMSKIEAGRMEIRASECDIAGMLNDVVSVHKVGAQQKGLELSLKLPSNLPPQLVTDGDKVRQILMNLIGNAIKFTRSGSVRVLGTCTSVGRDMSCLEVQVQDSGPGIDPQELPRLFRPFEQGDSQNFGTQTGTGLGLAISKRLAALLNGTLTVESELGRGSTFTLALTCPSVWRHAPARGIRKLPVGLQPGSPVGPILVVDDRESNRNLLKAMLELAGLPVCTAENGEEGLRYVESFRPIAVFMDVRMPVMDGETAVGLLRTDPRYRNLPVIAVSASVLDYDRVRQQQAGFTAFLRKPIEAESVFEVLAQHTELRFTYAEDKTVEASWSSTQVQAAFLQLQKPRRNQLVQLVDLLDFDEFRAEIAAEVSIPVEARRFAERLSHDFDQEGLLALLAETVSEQ